MSRRAWYLRVHGVYAVRRGDGSLCLDDAFTEIQGTRHTLGAPFYRASLPFQLINETGAASAGYDAYKYLTSEQVRGISPSYTGIGVESTTTWSSNCNVCHLKQNICIQCLHELYLTVIWALEDTVYFARPLQPPTRVEYWPMLPSNKTPWIFIGGSYPGESTDS